MADMFNTDTKFGGVFKGTLFSISLGGTSGGSANTLVQDMQLMYARNISRLFELGTETQYYIAGRTEGSGSLGQIVGPKGLVNDLVTKLGNVCNANQNTLHLSAGSAVCAMDGASGGSVSTSVDLTGVVCNHFQMGANAQNFVINSGLQIMFTGLKAA